MTSWLLSVSTDVLTSRSGIAEELAVDDIGQAPLAGPAEARICRSSLDDSVALQPERSTVKPYC